MLNKRDTGLRRLGELQAKSFAILKVPDFTDEAARIIGDTQEPYLGLFGNPINTAPTAEDRYLAFNCKAEIKTKVPKLTLHFGDTAIDAWYRGVYPNEASFQVVFVCPFCLEFKPQSDLCGERHLINCTRPPPPGPQIYKHGNLNVFQVDGERQSIYCQNLCMLAKLFLVSKQLYREVQSFYFFVLTELDNNGNHRFVGYFSKQKAFDIYKSPNPVQALSCIFTIPTMQKKGYGQFLIDLSYKLVTLQGNVGGPETPLSVFGRNAYLNYWKRRIGLLVYKLNKPNVSINELSVLSGMTPNHVVIALQDLGWLVNGSIVVRCTREMVEKWEQYPEIGDVMCTSLY